MTEKLYAINGFYMDMRSGYVKQGAELAWYVIEWEQDTLHWKDFRETLLGGTDPSSAKEGSLRNHIYQNWKDFGLDSKPNIGNNGVHGSASPLEALSEQVNWTGSNIKYNAFAKALFDNKLTEKSLLEKFEDPQVKLADGNMGSCFDSLEDQNADECIANLLAMDSLSAPQIKSNIKNSAFIFIKPHAVNQKVMNYVEAAFKKNKITVIGQGKLDAKTIDEEKLIDKHYGAIASKAMFKKPAELNPAQKKQDEFKELFGISWPQVLKEGRAYNAIDAVAKMGIDQDKMTKLWGDCKSNKKLVKFGGGFYAAEIEYTPKSDDKETKGGCSLKKWQCTILAAAVVVGAAFAIKKWQKK